jgi:molybdenum cofactor cytidylyltransferase
MTQPSLCGLILAAGDSSRMGRDKALLPWPPADPDSQASPESTLLAASIRALQPITQQIIVVGGNNIDELAPIASAHGAVLAHNPAPERGQFSSLQIGLRRVVELGYEAVALTPVDAPPLHRTTLTLLHTVFDEAIARGLWAIAPEHNGKHGHPLFAARKLIDAFLHADIASNARAVRQLHAELIQYLQVDDPLAGAEMNTPQQYAALAALIGGQAR